MCMRELLFCLSRGDFQKTAGSCQVQMCPTLQHCGMTSSFTGVLDHIPSYTGMWPTDHNLNTLVRSCDYLSEKHHIT